LYTAQLTLAKLEFHNFLNIRKRQQLTLKLIYIKYLFKLKNKFDFLYQLQNFLFFIKTNYLKHNYCYQIVFILLRYCFLKILLTVYAFIFGILAFITHLLLT